MEIKVDAMGQPCPQPVIRAKKTIEAMTEPGNVQVLVDNEVATSNLAKLAVQKNLESSTIKLDENQYSVTIKVTKEAIGMEQECDEVLQKNLVIVLSSDKMGDGDPELGTLLMKGFVYAISQLDELPKTILLYNAGAKLSVEGSDLLEDLKNLEEAGVEILTCGTCLNHFGLSDRLAVGSVTNMYIIAEKMAGAATIMRP